MSSSPGQRVRVRFCPSPTGIPHIGLVRTALFNWAYSRHTGGVFIFRVEDTDVSRDSEASYRQIVDTLRWLGLDWDEGPERGGEFAPYRQSERGDIYREVLEQLLDAGLAYESFSTPEEIEARNRAANRPVQLGYDNFDRRLTRLQKQSYIREGRRPIIRLRVSDRDVSFTDLVRGDLVFPAGSFSDFALTRPDKSSLYTLTNPVDDALMRVSHVMRGEDLLSSTPRQIELYSALIELGITSFTPVFAHLPMVLGPGNRKLSKRNPESDFNLYRQRGFIPEGLLNYLALLGWSYSAKEDFFTLNQLVERFDPSQVNGNPARFDLKKCEAINAAHLRSLPVEEFSRRALPFLRAAGLVADPPRVQELETWRAVAGMVQSRVQVLSEVGGLVEFLFVKEFSLGPAAVLEIQKLPDSSQIVARALDVLAKDENWADLDSLSRALRIGLTEELGIKPRLAFAPLRWAITGRRVSPPLFECMLILGPEEVSARLLAVKARGLGA